MRRVGAVLIVIAGIALTPSPVRASSTSPPINVPCSGSGGGAAGLVAGVNQANGSGGGTIVLSPNCNYQLAAPAFTGANGPDGLPPITTAITIEGTGATISATGTTSFRILEVTASGNLSLGGPTIEDGLASVGSGILNNGAATIAGSTITNNGVNGTGVSTVGDGIANNGTATITGSTISNNGQNANGAGIANAGRLTVGGSMITNNGLLGGTGEGGALYNTGQATVSHTTLAGNNGGFGGGGVANLGQLTVSNSVVTSNSAGGCPDCFANGLGGGLYNSSGSATVIATAVVGNHAYSGGGPSSAFGGGIYVAGGDVTLAGSPVADNTPDNCDPPGSVVGCVG